MRVGESFAKIPLEILRRKKVGGPPTFALGGSSVEAGKRGIVAERKNYLGRGE